MVTRPRIVALMGSQRRSGVIDTTVTHILAAAAQRGAHIDKIDLIEHDIRFCTNCRTCCQDPGPSRGLCVIDDDVDGILRRLEAADGVVLAASVNFGDVNSRTRQFLERMLGYAVWPWNARRGPVLRNRRLDKRAVLVTSSAAPAILTRWFASPLRTLRRMARLLRARPVDQLIVGLAGAPGFEPDRRTRRHIDRAVTRLLAV